jgi:hypothetical protein
MENKPSYRAPLRVAAKLDFIFVLFVSWWFKLI